MSVRLSRAHEKHFCIVLEVAALSFLCFTCFPDTVPPCWGDVPANYQSVLDNKTKEKVASKGEERWWWGKSNATGNVCVSRIYPPPPTELVREDCQDNVRLSTVAAQFLWESIFSLWPTVEPLDQEGRYLFLLQSDVAPVSNLQSSPPITWLLFSSSFNKDGGPLSENGLMVYAR